METIPVWVVILAFGLVGGLFWYGLRVFLNRVYDDRPIVCDMCGKLAKQTTMGKCPHCSHTL